MRQYQYHPGNTPPRYCLNLGRNRNRSYQDLRSLILLGFLKFAWNYQPKNHKSLIELMALKLPTRVGLPIIKTAIRQYFLYESTRSIITYLRIDSTEYNAPLNVPHGTWDNAIE